MVAMAITIATHAAVDRCAHWDNAVSSILCLIGMIAAGSTVHVDTGITWKTLVAM